MTGELSPDEKGQKHYYNTIAQTYDSYYASEPALRYRHRLYDRVLAGIDLQGKTALEAMCGGGQMTGYLLGKGCTVSAQDLSDEQCRLYQARYPAHDVRCESVLAMSFPDATFDLVIVDSLHHVHAQIDTAVEELLRVLKPGGLLLAWEPDANSPVDRLRRLWYRNDPQYFTDAEAAVDMDALVRRFDDQLVALRLVRGGNVAYFFVHGAMLFRIPHWLVRFYAPALIALEQGLDWLGVSQRFPAWVLALLQKQTR